jgi:signal transduction histidine kinase
MVIATIQDRTEQHRHEQMKKEFIATVSHELRTPLTAIAGSIALIASGTAGALPDAVVRLLKITSANCQRLICLVNEILDFAKIESGTVIFDLKPVDIRALVEQEIDGIRGFAAPYGVRVRSDRGAVHSVVQADADLLAQVLNNLLSNAIKYSPRGAEVVVGVENRHGMVRLSVRDHGPGIPDEYRERVFERFVQVDAKDARQRGGAGLGLSIVKEIVGRLNGEVGFEPAPGGGTVFYVTFPRWEEGMESGSGAQQRAGSSRSRESR